MSASITLRHHWDVLRTAWAEESARRKADARKQEAHEFLPAALEVLETPPSPIGRMLLWGMLGFVALAIAWASLGKLDVVVSAPGKLIPQARVKVLQSPDGGVVRGIYASDGQRVRAGQLLIELDPTQSGADAAQAASALATARLDKARAEALLRHVRSGSTRYTAPNGTDATSARTQATLVASEIAGLQAQLADLASKRAESAAMAGMARQERDKLTATLPLLDQRVAKRKELTDKGLSSGLLQLELEQQQLAHQRDIGVQAQSGDRYNAATYAIEMQMRALRQSFAKEAATLLAKSQSEIALREEELTKATQKSTLQRLTAPVDGIVQQLSLHTLGAVVKPADPILVVVPSSGALIVDAQILNKDVGQLKVGDTAAIKLEAFPFTRYGTIPGTLTQISRDAVQDEKLGLIYQAKVQVNCTPPLQGKVARGTRDGGVTPPPPGEGDRAQHGGGVIHKPVHPELMVSQSNHEGKRTRDIAYLCARLAPGLATTTDIKTDERHIITFLLSPIQRRLAEAGREE